MKHYAPRQQPLCSARYWPSRCTESMAETTCKSCIRALNTAEGASRCLSDEQLALAGRKGKPLARMFRRAMVRP